MTDRPNLILHTASLSARTPDILANAEHIKNLPIDGMVVNIPQSYFLMSAPQNQPPGAEVTQENLDNWLPQLAEFNVGMQNYLITFIDRPGDLFDDAAWGQVVLNFQLMAKNAKAAGFKGLVFDNEEYAGTIDNFPEDYQGASADDLPAYQAQAALRGREVMEAINAVFPEGAFAVTHGPYASVDGGPETPDAVLAQVGGPENQELRGPFFTGLLEGAGPDQKIIDMGELYGARTAQAYAESQAYRSDRVPELIDWDVDQGVLDDWDARVVVDHMVSTDQFPSDGVTPATLETALEGAFAHSEENVFLYSTVGTNFNAENLDWFIPGEVRPAWTQAIADAIADFEAGSAPEQTTEFLIGGARVDSLMGTVGRQEIYGNGGHDWLEGGAGADIVAGGKGWDFASYQTSGAAVTVDLVASTARGGHAQGDRLIGIENLWGSDFDDVLVGKHDASYLNGGAGNDRLSGNWGADTLNGGPGNDRLTGGGDADLFVFEDMAGAGRDVIADFDIAEGDRLLFGDLRGTTPAEQFDSITVRQTSAGIELSGAHQVMVLDGIEMLPGLSEIGSIDL